MLLLSEHCSLVHSFYRQLCSLVGPVPQVNVLQILQVQVMLLTPALLGVRLANLVLLKGKQEKWQHATINVQVVDMVI